MHSTKAARAAILVAFLSAGPLLGACSDDSNGSAGTPPPDATSGVDAGSGEDAGGADATTGAEAGDSGAPADGAGPTDAGDAQTDATSTTDGGPPFSHPELVAVPPATTFARKTCAAKDYGAKGDGVTDDTAAINMAIAACSSAGGGTVAFAPATYLVTSIHLMSDVKIALDAGVTIKGAATGYDAPELNMNDPNNMYEDFGHNHWHDALMWGEELVNVAVVGPGTIDGTPLVSGTPMTGQGDKQIALKSSRFVQFDGLKQTGGGHFFYLLTDCHDVTLSNLSIQNGRDGVDIVGNTDVNIHDVTMANCSDDTIALKSDYSLGRILTTDNVTVANCTVQSGSTSGGGANGLQFGSETVGDFQNISFSNITINQAGKAGIGIQTNDGAIIRNVSYDGITMHTVADPIFINTTSRLRRPPQMPMVTPGHVENVYIRNVMATDVRATNHSVPEMANAATISGESGDPHQHIVLENVTIIYNGDTGMPEGGAPDGSSTDATSAEASTPDTDASDAGSSGATPPDAGSSEAGSSDAGSSDAGLSEAGPSDAGASDAAAPWTPPYGGGSYQSGYAMPADPPSDYNPRVMGIRPAYGFYLRHAKDITLHNVKVGFTAPDYRPAIVALDIDTLTLDTFGADRAPMGAWPSIRLDNAVTNFTIENSMPQFPNVMLPDAGMMTSF
jgi:polygalacturonase